MSILTSLIEPVTGLLDKFIEDKDKKNAIAYELATMAERHAQELAKGQYDNWVPPEKRRPDDEFADLKHLKVLRRVPEVYPGMAKLVL